MPELHREQEGEAYGEFCKLAPLLDLIPKQLIVRAAVSPLASCRPLLISTAGY